MNPSKKTNDEGAFIWGEKKKKERNEMKKKQKKQGKRNWGEHKIHECAQECREINLGAKDANGNNCKGGKGPITKR